MKEIDLVFSGSIKITFGLPNTPTEVSFNSEIEKISMDMAEKNAVKIIKAHIHIENRIGSIISDFSVPYTAGYNKKTFFDNEILGASYLTFASKRKILKNLIESQSYLSKDEVKKLESLLHRIGEIRNAFSHGKMHFAVPQNQVELTYHSGGNKVIILSDQFLDDIVVRFKSANDLLWKVLSQITQENLPPEMQTTLAGST